MNVQQVRVIEDRNTNVLIGSTSGRERWKKNVAEQKHEENNCGADNNKDQWGLSEDGIEQAMSGKAVGPDNIPVEVWQRNASFTQACVTTSESLIGQNSAVFD